MAFFERVHGENFVIYQGNEVKENSNATGLNRGKESVRVPFQDRTMLQNSSKVQPQQTTKQSFGVENCAVKCSSQLTSSGSQVIKSEQQVLSFAIFEDVNTQKVTEHSVASIDIVDHEEMDLHPAFTTVFKNDTPNRLMDLSESIKGDSIMSLCTPDEEMIDNSLLKVNNGKIIVKKELDDKHLWFPEYHLEIYQYLREAEVRLAVRPDYMRKQTEITYNMRSILVDWMVEVAEEYKLERETLCLSVTFVDRFLSVMAVARNKLQLVGTAAMFIAAKYEEIYPPDVGEFVYITDNSYTKKQVLQMERLILRTLSFSIASPTVNCFCSNLLTSLSSEEKTSSLTMYMLELSMLDGEKFLKYLPSIVAASCVCLAYRVMEHGECRFGFHAHTNCLSDATSALCQNTHCQMIKTVTECTGYLPEVLEPCIADLNDVYNVAATLQHPAIREKYSKDKWHRVSSLTAAWTS